MVDRVVGLREARAFPANGRSAGKISDGIDGGLDRLELIRELVHRALQISMAHEFPVELLCRFGNARIGFTDEAVGGHCGRNSALLERFQDAPEADPHSIFVPGPVGQIGLQGLAHWRTEDCARHRPFDGPVFDIDDDPDDHPPIIGDHESGAVDDGAVGDAVAEQLIHGF